MRISQLTTGEQIAVRNALRRQRPDKGSYPIVDVIIAETGTARIARLELQAPDLSHPVETVTLH